jgi:hypothetical protein
MKSLPLPIRVAAGLAVTAVEQARTLPAKIAGLPVTVASQALQVSMRVQQQVTELAIRGDEVLASLRPVEETPEWATFDEDVENDGFDSKPTPFESAFDRVEDESGRHNGYFSESTETLATPDLWTQEEQAFAEEAGVLEDSGYGADEPEDDYGDGRSWPTAGGGDRSRPERAGGDPPPLEVVGDDRPLSEGAGDESLVGDEDRALTGAGDGGRPSLEVVGEDRRLSEVAGDESLVGGEDQQSADGGRASLEVVGEDPSLSEVAGGDRSLAEVDDDAGGDQSLTGVAGEGRSVADTAGGDRPLSEVTGYDELSLPQLRARLRRFDADELAELLEYERGHGNRPSFVGMLTRRIAAVRDQR